ncbi:bifunctional transcriptional activator/DNA repair enzyme AdaA [Pararhodonellum marinum]|uniref:bifunctional transcriptional activator/DNA repair enzyme AdaA n=1 Tax=Pararhodonellum marinum TaxID=2755358 RepID=UPI001E2CE07F|nr:trifunctional transcriptional activator/DNA repair protein Ada/methylated-DNA--[protein]-cysteine S-methyltransferase [Pararhodonellum marinum]
MENSLNQLRQPTHLPHTFFEDGLLVTNNKIGADDDPSFERMFQAVLEKDSTFEGVFFTGVKTTGIFCRPTCTAKKPKIENVEFFNDTKAAMLKGYRPCKICRPLENPSKTPDAIKEIMNFITQNPFLKIKDYDLVKKGLDPTQVRRWFQKNHGMTFHAYQRLYRLNSAFKKIKEGESITGTAFESGFESLSGFQDSFRQIFGVSPTDAKKQTILDLKRIETPLGTMVACASPEGICLLEFTDRKMLETSLKKLAKSLNATIIQGANVHFETLEMELSAYFEGKLKNFETPLHLIGSEFQLCVWNMLKDIPYGATRSYKQQAEAIGKPSSVRAVANANGMNKIAILIPCHRVIGTDGQLTGYGGGIWRKKKLLMLEKTLPPSDLFGGQNLG